MKHLRFNLLAALLCLVSCALSAANVLRVDSVKYPAGKTVALPIILENQSDIAGVQFDISVPFELATNESGVQVAAQLAANRAPYHTVASQKLGTEWRDASTHGGVSTYHKYRFIVYSDQNALILDNQGTLLTLQLPLSGDAANGASYPIYLLSNSVVLSDRQKQNVATDQKNGLVTIEVIPRPDLVPSDVAFQQSTAEPGGKLNVTWTVKNTGQASTDDGWSEQISLVTVAGNLTKLISTTYYDQKLAANGQVSRQAEIELPALLGLDGVAKVQVTVVPGEKTGEHPSLRDNNTAQSTKNLTVSKKLMLELSRTRISEGSGERIAAKLSRSGRWNTSRTFAVSTGNGSRLDIAQTVTIPADQSGTVFYFSVKDNDVLDNDSVVTISVSGDSYEAATARLIVEDNEFPTLSVKASKSVVTEGETFQLTISTERTQAGPTVVSIASEDSKRFNYPAQATIPAGQKQVTVDVTAIDNEVPNLELANRFTVSAQKFTKGEAIVILQDNDMPLLTLTLTPNKVSEDAGPTAVAAVLRRTGNTNSKITVRISDDAEGGLYYSNRSVEMARGVEEVYFNLGPVDNVVKESDRTYHVSAGVWVSSCSCSASGEQAGSVTAQLVVLDNDGLSLGITTQASTVKEGGKTKLTIKRNTTDTSQALSVRLSSDYDSQLNYPKTAVIPAGQQTVDVEMESKQNSVSGDSRTVVFTVEADGYSSGTCYLLITDQTLPDARISAFSSSVAEAVIGSTITLTATLANEGAAPLPVGTSVKFYRRGQNEAIGTVRTEQAIAVGGKLDVVRRVVLPDEVGQQTFYAVVNENRDVSELVYTNNTSVEAKVVGTSPFTATVKTNKKVYAQGEKIIITGKLAGDRTASTKIEVYFINDGARQTEEVTTDTDGSFMLEWVPYGLQSGHFVVGACFPGDKITEEQATFDVYGLRRASSGYITEDVLIGETRQGFIELLNPGSLALSGLKTEKLSGPDDVKMEFDLASTLAGNQSTTLTDRISGSVPTEGNQWDPLVVRVTSKEGAQLDITIYYYARVATGNLVVASQQLNTTMLKSTGRDYSFIVTNNGKGNTGRISLALPNWMSALTGSTMPGLNQNDTATVVLRFTPTADMQLNVPVTGRIGINCENGNGTYINFSITPVSEATGTLVVDVTDEYTYYTEEAPHLADAQIVLRNPYTDALVAQGISDANGLFTIENLPEGYYKLSVSADKHSSYQNSILVDPGTTTTKVVTLNYQAISISWDVVETEVEDEYDIVTTVTYETNVPVPVIEMIAPDKIDAESLGVGESLVFNVIITNKGLITGKNTVFSVPDTYGGYSWEPLVECNGREIAPQQSIVIPVKVTRLSDEEAASRGMFRAGGSEDGCHMEPRVVTEYECGNDGNLVETKKSVQFKVCKSNATGGGSSGFGTGPGWPNGGAWYTVYGQESNNNRTNVDRDCRECGLDMLKWAFDCAVSFAPGGMGCAYGLASGTTKIASGTASTMDYVTTVTTGIGCGLEAAGVVIAVTGVGLPATALLEGIGMGINALNCLLTANYGCMYKMLEDADKKLGITAAYRTVNSSRSRKMRAQMIAAGEPAYVTRFSQAAGVALKMQTGYLGYQSELFGDTLWLYNTSMTEMYALLQAVVKQETHCTVESLKPYQPENVTDGMLARFVERLDNTNDFLATGTDYENRIHSEELLKMLGWIEEAEQEAHDMGYVSAEDMWQTEGTKFYQEVQKGSNSVCSTITLQINQTMTMTRQAFRGTLTVYNGNQGTPMENVKMKLNVTNLATGEVATLREFEMHTESLMGFEGDLAMDSGWHLGTDSTGTATILFIPSKYAAPETPVDYSFGGTLSYIDPYTDLEVTRELYPVTLTVKPSPELDLTYFMERDILGDNALTEEVEPMVPSEFALIINNKGYGDATNVRMVTNQPEIIENQKGLLIDFEFLSSQLNGQEKTLALGQSIPTEFGTIAAHTQAYAQWWLQSTLLGHFIDYDIQATHVTSYGNENLSLLDQVTIHELVHGFTPAGTAAGRAFLVNDVTDSEDLPDAIYFTDATQDAVNIIGNASVTKTSDTEYRLVMMPSNAGWSYGSVLDPTVGRQKLTKIVRLSDNQEMPLDNVWQTAWTIPDGQEPMKDNRLHFVANMPIAGDTYVLTFAPKPAVELAVAEFEGVPQAGTLQTEPLKTVTVTFNKAIKAETFTSEDITLACQGQQLDASKITITRQSDTTFRLNIGALSNADGYYVLTVQTATITDHEGFEGSVGKQATWVQYAGGKISLVLKSQPANAGTLSPTSGMFDYDKPVTLTATAKEGYDFSKWTENGMTISEQPSFSYTPQGSSELTAVFTPKYYDVTITTGEIEGGTIEGGGTGHYAYGTTLTLTATPKTGYEFDYWALDGKKQSTAAPTFTWTVTKSATIQAVFRELPEGTLAGRVTNAIDDTPIEGATITLSKDQLVYTATTDAYGRYALQVEDKSLTYDISCQADGFIWSPNSQVWFTEGQQTKNFALLPGATVELPDDGICTFSPTVDVEVSNLPVQVWYISQFDQQHFVLKAYAWGTVKAGEGLILVGTSDARRIDMNEATSAATISDNLLTGTGSKPYTVTTDNIYVLQESAESRSFREQGSTSTYFYKAAKGLVIPKGKAYCQYTISSGQPDEIGVLWSDLDLIEAVRAALSDPNAPHYDLQGRRIYKTDEPGKLHVVKGKKVIVK